MIDLYLSVPGGKPIGDLHDEIVGLGFDGARVDIPDEHGAATEVLREFADRPHVKGILLLAGGHMTRQHPKEGGPAWKAGELEAHVHDTCIKMRDLGLFHRLEPPAIEIGNEPDLAVDEWKRHPRDLGYTFARCYAIVRGFSDRVPVLCPSVSNLNERGFSYLTEMQGGENRESDILPLACDVAVHRYPNGSSVTIPHRGFGTREDETRKLLDIAGGRTIWVTETGMREGPHDERDCWRKGHYLSELQVAGEFEREVTFWNSVPQVQGLVWYAINDGPDRKNELHTYGIRKLVDGKWQWKEVAARVAALKEMLS